MVLGAVSLILIVITLISIMETAWAFIVLGIIILIKVGLKIGQNVVFLFNGKN